jgi:N-acetylglucosaminyldiphosphoundecaprenol N-acetyl-beta-D-mannosaminyltransferase
MKIDCLSVPKPAGRAACCLTTANQRPAAPSSTAECDAKIPVRKTFSRSKATTILGVSFDAVTTLEALDRIEQMIASRQPHYLATANVDFVVQSRRDLELRRILSDADMVLCDGTPLVWASRWLGNPLPERVAGADLVPALIERAAEKGYRIFLLGATPRAAQLAVEKLAEKFPALHVASFSPPFKPLLEMDHAEIRRRISAEKPDVLLVAFGCPKQEKWIAMHYRELGVPVCIGVGATVDFLAGYMKRAPRWMQRTGTEWLFRLAQEPRRLFKRYAVDLGVFGFGLLRKLWQFRFRDHRNKIDHACSVTLQTNGWQHIALPKRFDRAAVERSEPLLKQALAGSRHCLLEARDVEFFDSAGIACLMRLRRELSASQRQLILLSPSRAARDAIAFMRLEEFFVIADDIDAAHRLSCALLQEQSHPVIATEPLIWQGEITVGNAFEVWRATQSRLSARKRDEFAIDLSRVRFLDTSGVETMQRVCEFGMRSGIRISFQNPTPAVCNVLRHARLESLLVNPKISGPPISTEPALAFPQTQSV